MRIGYRAAETEDMGFVRSNWLRSFWESPYAGPIALANYYETYDRQLDFLLGKKDVRVLVAYNPVEEGPYNAYGFICHEGPRVVHYLYVKPEYRDYEESEKLLVAHGLMAEAKVKPPFVYTFPTWAGERWLRRNGLKQRVFARRKGDMAEYDPRPARRRESYAHKEVR